jgi:serine/threonine-protein kinase RsbW
MGPTGGSAVNALNTSNEMNLIQPQTGREEWRPQDVVELNRRSRRLADSLEKALERQGYDAASLRLRSVLEEAVLNAWKHGNQARPGSLIQIEYRLGDRFELDVLDQGPGFDPETVADPTTAENLEKTCGRGIFIMRHFADDIQWRRGGRQVRIVLNKSWTPGAPKPTDPAA